MRTLLLSISIAIVLLVVSCSPNGKELGRVEISKLSTTTFMNPASLDLDLKKDATITFWCDLDMQYEDSVDLMYYVKIIKDRRTYANFSFDPRQCAKKTVNEMTEEANQISWKIIGQGATYSIPMDALYTFEVSLVINNNQSFRINHADFMIKR